MFCWAGQGGGSRGGFGGRGDPNRQYEMPKEFIDYLMGAIKEKDPAKAKELEALRQSDPAKFKEQIMKIGPEQFKTIWDEGGGFGGGRGVPGGGRGGDGGRGGPDGGRRGQRDERFIKWLTENFPADANSLKNVDPDKDNQKYYQIMDNLRRRFGSTFDRIQDNPKLNDVLVEELRLGREQWNIVTKIQRAKTENEKTSLKPDLEKIVNQLYDVKVKIKEIEFERLLERLEQLREYIEATRKENVKWKDPETKKDEVTRQVERLIKPPRGPFGF